MDAIANTANIKLDKVLSDFRRGLQARQMALNDGVEAKTLEKMTSELHRILDQAELFEIECRRATIQRPLQRAFLLFSEVELREYRKVLSDVGQLTTFYLELPELVVRSNILSFLTNPQDLLNLLIAIPSEEKLAPLTKVEVERELAFQDMITAHWERNGKPLWDDDHQLRHLSMTSDHHRKMILRQFENFLVKDISNTERITCISTTYVVGNENYVEIPPYYKSISINRVVRSMEGVALQAWNKFPVTSKVAINMGRDYRQEEMERIGNSVWHAEICITRRMWTQNELELEPYTRQVGRCLEQMPNLRNLHLRHALVDDNAYDGDGIQFPELPLLKALNFHELKFNNGSGFRLLRMLLEKYGEQLNQLGFSISSPSQISTNPINFPPNLPRCTKLSLLSFIDHSVYQDTGLRTWQSSRMVSQFMSNFGEAPLKTIKLTLNDSNSLKALYELLDYMSRTFGSSLERLELEFGQLEWRYRLEAPSPTLLRGLHFTKLVHFGTNLCPTRELYEAVIKFSVLETLQISKSMHMPIRQQNAWDNLKGDNQKCWKQHIWKKLPHLKWIGYYKNWYYEHEKITRKDVEEIEEKKNGEMLKLANFCKDKIRSYFGRGV